MVVVKINDKILLYIFGYFGLYTFGSCIPLGLVYLWLVYLWLCIPLGDIPPAEADSVYFLGGLAQLVLPK